MPLYEYQCDACGDVFEVIQKFSDTPLTSHEGCGGKLTKLLSPAALQFKGTGWYVTDYAHKNGSGSNGGSSKPSAGSESSSKKVDSGASSKPDAGKTA